MFCIKCGCELPEDAAFCFKCGNKTPSSIISESNREETGKKEDDEIVNRFKVGDNEIVFNKSQSKELLVRGIFEKNAEISRCYLMTFGLYELDNFEQIYNEYYDLFLKIVNQNLTVAVRALLKMGIDSYDKYFLNNAVTQYLDLESGFKAYYHDLEMIEEKILEFSADAHEREKIKNPWIGGGAGFTGALVGAAKADILNAGSNLIGKIGDGIINALDKRTISKLKQECFENHSAVFMLADILYEIVCAVGQIVYQIMIAENKAKDNNWTDLNKIIAKRNNLFELHETNSINKDDLIKKLSEYYNEHPFAVYAKNDILALNPFLEYDISLLCKLDGTSMWFNKTVYELGYSFSLIYWRLCVRDEGNNLPELYDGEDRISKILNDDLIIKLYNNEDEYESNRILNDVSFKVGLFKTLIEKNLPSKKEMESATNQEMASILTDESMFIKPVQELIVYSGVSVSEAMECVQDILKHIFVSSSEKIEELINSFIELIDDIENKTREMTSEEKLSLLFQLNGDN